MLMMGAFYILTDSGVVIPLSALPHSMPKTPKQKPIALIVRQGSERRFRELKEKTAHLPVTVAWDRRTQDRRSPSDSKPTDNRRKEDRRQAPPFTWDVSDFVVAVSEKPKKRKRR
jgi:hypothetical protein